MTIIDKSGKRIDMPKRKHQVTVKQAVEDLCQALEAVLEGYKISVFARNPEGKQNLLYTNDDDREALIDAIDRAPPANIPQGKRT